jgi:hypothetical protein
VDRLLNSGAVLEPALRSAAAARTLLATLRSPLMMRVLVVLAVVLAVLGGGAAVRATRPIGRAERALTRGDSAAALSILEPLERTPEVLALRGRALAQDRRPGEALSAWDEAAKTDPTVLAAGPILTTLVDELGGSRAQAAGDLLAKLGGPGKRALVEATRSDAYRKRWAAVEALRRIHADDAVDLRDVYLADLRVRDCNVVVRAAGKLADLGDERAVELLREIAQRKAVLGLTEACEAPAARAALKRLEKR